MSSGTMSSSVLYLQKRQNKSFKDGVLRLRSASLLLYDEVDSPCSFLLKPCRGYNSRVTAHLQWGSASSIKAMANCPLPR